MESGAILDSWINSSSEDGPTYQDHLARLHIQRTAYSAGGWAARDRDTNQWLQVDLQRTTRVTGIATQGRSDFNQWVKTYKLQYGEDGHTLKFYRGNGDHSDTVWKSY